MPKTKPKRNAPRRNFRDVVSALLGRAYVLGGNGSVKGDPFDCFGMMVECIYLRYGVDLYVSCDRNKHDIDGWAKSYEVSREETMSLFNSFLKDIFQSVPLGFLFAGDFVWSTIDEKQTFGLYCGLQRMLVTTQETGCVLIGSEGYNIKEAYRWQH